MSQWIQSRVNSGNESDADGFTPPPNSPESVPAPRELFDGGPDMIQLLTPSGERIRNKATAAYDAYADALTDEELRSFYRDLVLIRRMDNEANALQRQGELGIWVPLLGQEAAQIGIGRALRPQDYAFPTYREHGVAWCRGIQPEQLISLFRGVDHGNWIPDEHNFHLYAIVIGAQALHAVGYAMGVQRDGATATGNTETDAAVATFFGDGASSQGDVNESFVFAAVNHAPVVFFCQNNQFAISEPNHKQFTIPLYQRANGFGFPGVRIDGNDILASYAVSRAMLDRARDGAGPSLIEAYTYRMGAHTTSDDPTKYRDASEVELWKQRDPISRFAAYLRGRDIADDAFFAAVDEEAKQLGIDLRASCLSMPNPGAAEMFDHVYNDMPKSLAAQRDEYLAYAESFESGDVA